ncbi:MAG: HAD family hydrolase [Candidatus Marinimicrobia bacterium]|nr:HAD family hydrolase [Candidatus Neomarinimicrobiota bacterium]
MKIKHIIWDWNGTLLNDLWLGIEAINVVLKRYDLPIITKKTYLDIFTFPVIEYYKKLGFDFNKNPFEIVGTEFIEEYTRRQFEAKLHPDALNTMACLQSMSISQSLLSAATQGMLDTLTNYHNIQDRFMKIIGQNNHYAYGKEEAGKQWMNELHVGPHEVLFVGDTLHDLDVAKSIGADCVLISTGHTSYDRLQKSGAPTFHSLADFVNDIFSDQIGFEEVN